MSHAKISVTKGEMLASAVAFVTEILCIASIQNSFERPRSTTPLIKMNGSYWSRSREEACAPKRIARRAIAGNERTLRRNITLSLEASARAFCWK